MRLSISVNKVAVLFLSFLLVFGLLCVAGSKTFAEEKTLRLEVDAWIIKKFPVKQAARRFEEDHPGVKVEVNAKDYENFVKTYLLNFSQGNTTVDLGIGGMPMQLAPLVGAGHLVDLSDMLTGKMAKDEWASAFLQNGKFVQDGKETYPVLPFMGEVMGLNVNKEYMDKIGALDEDGNVIPPEDFAEFEEYVKKLSEVAPGPGLSVSWGWNFIDYSYVSGVLALEGDIYAEDGNMLDFASDGAKKWLKFNQDLIADDYAASGTIGDVNYGRNNFKSGIIPAIFTAHSRFIGGASVLGEDKVSFIPIPGASENGTIAFSHTVYVPKVSPNVDLAKQFIKEQIFSKWFQQWSFNRYGKLPVISDYYEDVKWFQQEADTILKMAQNGVSYPKYKGADQLHDIIMEELHMVLLNKQTPEETLKAIREKIKNRDVDLTRLDK